MEEVWLIILVVTSVSFALLLTYVADGIISSKDDGDSDGTSVVAEQTVKCAIVNDIKKMTRRSEQEESNRRWKCACEDGGSFLPPSLVRSVGGPSAFIRAGVGNCYHKKM